MSNTVGRCHDRDAQGLPPGDSLNGFTDALRRDGEFGWEHVRHEEAAAFAAAGRAYKSTPVARGRTGQRQRIAAAVAWGTSGEADYVTDTTVIVDRGASPCRWFA